MFFGVCVCFAWPCVCFAWRALRAPEAVTPPEPDRYPNEDDWWEPQWPPPRAWRPQQKRDETLGEYASRT